MTTDTTEAATTEAPRRLGLALVVISAAQLMVVLDATIVNVALPSIQRGLHFSSANLVWVTSAYALTFGSLLLFGGRTGDLFGRRRMFLIGIGIFAVASLLGGLAQSADWLIASRAAQGVGGAIASPTALALIATNFPEGAPRNRAMGIYAAMSGAGGAVGLLAGGLLTELATWRWVLFVNVPIAAVALILGPRVLSESETRAGRLDIPGTVTVTAGMALLVYGLTNAATHSWGSPSTVAYLIGGLIVLVGFVLLETRTANPLMPLHIFANRNRSGAYGIMLCLGAAVFAMFFFLTQYLQDVVGYTPIETGLAFLPVAVTIGAVAQVASRLVGRIGIRPLLLAGPSIVAVGLFWLTRLTVDSGYGGVLGPLLCIAIGMGLSFVPLTLTAVAGVVPTETGLASALLNTGQQIGGAVGLALLSTVAVEATRSVSRQLAASNGGQLSVALGHQAVVHGYTRAFLVAASIGCLAILVSLLAIRAPRPPREVVADAGALSLDPAQTAG
jgi:EmrB/QacA subfamily drug resistance transporter